MYLDLYCRVYNQNITHQKSLLWSFILMQLSRQLQMFRVKNVRGATVARNNNFSPAIQNQKIEKQGVPKKKNIEVKEEENKKDKKIENKYQIKTLTKTKKDVIHPDQRAGDQIISNANKIKPPSRTKVTSSMVRPNRSKIKGKDVNILTLIDTVKQNEEKIEKIEKIKDQQNHEIITNAKQKQEEKKGETLGNHVEQEILERQKLLQIIKIEQKKDEQRKIEMQEEIERQKMIQKSREERLRKKKQEQEAQIMRQAEAQKQIEKIMQRRKQRELDRARDKQLQQKREKQLKLLAQKLKNEPQKGGGMMYTNDSLAHFQFSDIIMDAQIAKILRTSFNHFPSGQQIEMQKSQLERINTSYQMIKHDKNNERLLEGLKNYRVQLFNRIGQLIMEDQRKGFKPTNFSIVQTDSRTNKINEEAQILRGIPKDKIGKVIGTQVVKIKHECSICLEEINVGQNCNILSCKHAFHIECSSDWIQMTANCPSCRQNLKF